MASFNKIMIVGYLGKDPEIRYTAQGQAVTNFSIATSEKRKDAAGEAQEITTWFKVTFWGKQAELANQYLSKGKQVYVEGRLRQTEWTDREGNKRQSLEVNGTDLHFLSAKGDEMGGGGSFQSSGAPAASRQAAPPADDMDQSGTSDSDIPF